MAAQIARSGCRERVDQIAVDQRQHDLRFGIAEAHVELDHLRARAREHQAAVEEAAIRVALGAHAGDDGRDDLVEDPALERGVAQRARRERAHPTGVRPRDRRRRRACDPAPSRAAPRARRRSARRYDSSGPVRHSSITSRAPASPNRRSRIIAVTAPSAVAASAATTTPLPAARPSALSTTGIAEPSGGEHGDRLRRPSRTRGTRRSARRGAP